MNDWSNDLSSNCKLFADETSLFKVVNDGDTSFFTIGNGGDKRLRKSKNIFSHRTLPLAASHRTLSLAASHKTLSLAASHRKLSLAASHRTLSLAASEYLYMVSMNAVAKDFL